MNWLSLQPRDNHYSEVRFEFGEMNANNNLHGRGICIYPDGYIHIGYWNNGDLAPGKYIHIFSKGKFDVGELYLKDGKSCWRGTNYKVDGTSKKYDTGL